MRRRGAEQRLERALAAGHLLVEPRAGELVEMRVRDAVRANLDAVEGCELLELCSRQPQVEVVVLDEGTQLGEQPLAQQRWPRASARRHSGSLRPSRRRAAYCVVLWRVMGWTHGPGTEASRESAQDSLLALGPWGVAVLDAAGASVMPGR